ncbi:hypothetical protein WBU86_20140 [Escherichia coli]
MGAWQSVGFVAEKQLHDKLQHKGMSTLTTEEGLAHLDACLLDNTSCRLAMRLATPPLMTQKRLYFIRLIIMIIMITMKLITLASFVKPQLKRIKQSR